MRMKRKDIISNATLLTLVLAVYSLIMPLCAKAQRLVAEAPAQVSVGQQFRLTYTVNTQQVSNFRVGNIPEELEVLIGPRTSSQMSYQMVNGRTSSSSSITYTYILSATKKGKYSIPAAHITAEGKSLTSNELQITVHESAHAQGGNSHHQGSNQPMREAGSQISSSDLFIKVSANKEHVVEQEPILLTYKVYSLVDLTQLEGKMPDLKGFHIQEVQLPQQKSFKVETYNGRPYRTVTWSQYVMFPQVTGKLSIPSITFNGIVVQMNRNIDPFEAFFNGGSSYVEVKKRIQAPGLTIQVSPLPTKPANFSLGVGNFNISAQLDKQQVKANDPVKLRVTISGVGNLKLIKEPIVNLPKDFDRYDAKITDKTKRSSKGVEGSMVYDYLMVPRHQGKYEIPPVEFTYYDTQKRGYQTVKTEAFTLEVAKGSGTVSSYSGREDVKQLNRDIRYIKQGTADLRPMDDFFFGSAPYLWLLGGQLLVFISLFIIFRKRAMSLQHSDLLRGKQANKVATKRLKLAGKLLQEGKKDLFYDEVLRALWGYVGDKLNMPVEQLSRENINQRLAERDVPESTLLLFLSALDECEFERYAPGDATGNMNKTYEAAMTAITSIENVMKKKKPQISASINGWTVVWSLLFTLALTLQPINAAAEQANKQPSAQLSESQAESLKQKADKAYADQNYQEAIRGYEQLLKGGVSPNIYYNLGNAYFRTDNLPRAILNYERALLLSPGDRDIRINLQMAREKTIDKITPESEMFFITWYRSLVNLASVDGWATTAQLLLTLVILLSLLYLFANPIWLRKTGFFGALLLFVAFGLCNLFAAQQKDALINRTGALIISPAATIKSTPAQNGTDLYILHEGTKVEIVDNSMRDWKEVRVADGKMGWIEARQLEVI